jgi:hypothetical protein
MNRHFPQESEGALVRCAVWLFVGFVGASIVAAGVLGMFGAEARPLGALTTALCGGAMAGVGWYRARKILEAQVLGSGTDGSFASDDDIVPPDYRCCFEQIASTDLQGGV